LSKIKSYLNLPVILDFFIDSECRKSTRLLHILFVTYFVTSILLCVSRVAAMSHVRQMIWALPFASVRISKLWISLRNQDGILSENFLCFIFSLFKHFNHLFS